MKERKVVIAPNGRKFKFPKKLRPDLETFAENTLKVADTDFRDTIHGDVAMGLVSIVFAAANRGATHEKQLDKLQKFTKLSIRRYDRKIIPFLRDELGPSLTGEDLALKDS